MELLKVQHGQIVTASNKPIRLRGWNVGGWLNMEDFIDGFVGAEHNLRATMAASSARKRRSSSLTACSTISLPKRT